MATLLISRRCERQNPGKTQDISPIVILVIFIVEILFSNLLIIFKTMEKYDDLLNESKRTISKWEHEFQKTHGNRPSKVKRQRAFFLARTISAVL
jgi:hypothetical protein